MGECGLGLFWTQTQISVRNWMDVQYEWMDIKFTKHCYTFKKDLYFNDTVHKKQMPAFAFVGHKCKANPGSFGMNSAAGPIILHFLMQNLYT